ncbi:MAG: KOW domain-containing RNA-binding protein [Clostridiales bacterium]|jgi:ribosomal protein L14E/L6E/L27E|nr:KOW domain-containing RNA-binding protein [Clostridiales bacterium]
MDIGSVVYSKAGRDSERYYIVTGLSEKPDYVYIIDGELRRLEKPKLKKIKHLRDTGAVVEKLAEKFKSKKLVHNAEIRSALRQYNDKSGQLPEEERR